MSRHFFSSWLLCWALLLVGACKSTEIATNRAHTRHQAPYQATCTRHHDLLHTKLEVSFDWQRQHLHGVATLKLQPHCYPQRYLILDACGFAIHQVAMVQQTQQSPLKYTYDGRKLIIDLGQALPAETAYQVAIAYTAQPNEVGKYRSITPFSSQGLFFIQPDGSAPDRPRQIWTQGQPQSNSCWFPTIDAPNQRCTQEVYITVEQHLKTLSNGVLAYAKRNNDGTRTDCWQMDLPHAPYLFMLAVGDFAEVQDTWNDLEVNYYVEPAYAQHARAIFGHTPEMLEFFSQKLDYPYPWPKYSQIVVRDHMMGAMENTSAVVFSDMLQVDDRQLLDNDHDDIIAHELFHHWFGNLVTCESWAHLPLNEAFACLGDHLWREHKYGKEAGALSVWYTLQGYLQEATHKQVHLVRFHHAHVGELFDRHSYNKGALVLHMLRQYVGEEVFFKALHHYLKKHAFSTVEIHQLRKAFEDITGEDLNWFFNQWFFAAGHPMLKMAHTYNDGTLTVKIWQQQNATTTPIYRLPLTIAVWAQGEPQQYAVVVDQPYHEFTWTLPEPPALVHLDQRSLLLGVVEHAKSVEEYQHLYYQGEDFFAKQEALAYCSSHMRHPICCQVLQEALQDDFWFFRKMAVDAFRHYAGKDMAVIEALLIELSKHDDKAAVRAAGLGALASLQDPAKYVEVYKQGLQDRSYHVVSTALRMYATTSNAPDKMVHLASLEACDHRDVVMALAHYYTQVRQPDKYAWLQGKLTKLLGRTDDTPLVVALGQYLAVVPNEKEQQAGLAWFRQITSPPSRPHVRRAVGEALQHMRRVPGVDVLLKELKASHR
ncbi:MAG: M1 family metallopeptidase [Roseivirga sp.]